MEAVTVEDVERAVNEKNIPALEKIIGQKCVALCINYSQPPSVLAAELEAFLLNNGSDALTLENFGKFEQTIKNLLKQPIRERNINNVAKKFAQSPDKSSKRPATFPTPQVNKSLKFETPSASPHGVMSPESGTSQASQSDPHSTFRTRTNRGQLVTDFNPTLPHRSKFVPSKSLYGIHGVLSSSEYNNVAQRYRYMFTTLEERAYALDSILSRLQEDMAAEHKLEIYPVGIPSQDLVWVCGRVCNEASDGKLNKTAIVLEGSRVTSGGRRIQVDLSEMPQFAFFPGQIVCLQGICASGRKIIVKNLIPGVPRPLPKTPPKQLLEWHHSTYFQNGQPLNVIVVSGPYTTTDNLEYEPLMELLEMVAQTKPDLCVFCGPFVDITQPLLASADVMLPIYDENNQLILRHGASYEMVFVEKFIRDGLTVFYNSEEEFGASPTHFVLIPSLNDAHHEFVFPQPPFGDRDRVETDFFEEPLGVYNIPYSAPGESKRVHVLPNPCTFRFNEIVFGSTSNDILFALSSDEVSQAPGNRLARLASHLLSQQSYYPVFPAPASTVAQLDMRHYKHWMMDVSPDVLILPSRMNHMVTDVNGTLVINPGQLAKGANGGTYATMTVHPIKEEELKAYIDADDNSAKLHRVAERSRVSISRI